MLSPRCCVSSFLFLALSCSYLCSGACAYTHRATFFRNGFKERSLSPPLPRLLQGSSDVDIESFKILRDVYDQAGEQSVQTAEEREKIAAGFLKTTAAIETLPVEFIASAVAESYRNLDGPEDPIVRVDATGMAVEHYQRLLSIIELLDAERLAVGLGPLGTRKDGGPLPLVVITGTPDTASGPTTQSPTEPPTTSSTTTTTPEVTVTSTTTTITFTTTLPPEPTTTTAAIVLTSTIPVDDIPDVTQPETTTTLSPPIPSDPIPPVTEAPTTLPSTLPITTTTTEPPTQTTTEFIPVPTVPAPTDTPTDSPPGTFSTQPVDDLPQTPSPVTSTVDPYQETTSTTTTTLSLADTTTSTLTTTTPYDDDDGDDNDGDDDDADDDGVDDDNLGGISPTDAEPLTTYLTTLTPPTVYPPAPCTLTAPPSPPLTGISYPCPYVPLPHNNYQPRGDIDYLPGIPVIVDHQATIGPGNNRANMADKHRAHRERKMARHAQKRARTDQARQMFRAGVVGAMDLVAPEDFPSTQEAMIVDTEEVPPEIALRPAKRPTKTRRPNGKAVAGSNDGSAINLESGRQILSDNLIITRNANGDIQKVIDLDTLDDEELHEVLGQLGLSSEEVIELQKSKIVDELEHHMGAGMPLPILD